MYKTNYKLCDSLILTDLMYHTIFAFKHFKYFNKISETIIKQSFWTLKGGDIPGL